MPVPMRVNAVSRCIYFASRRKEEQKNEEAFLSGIVSSPKLAKEKGYDSKRVLIA